MDSINNSSLAISNCTLTLQAAFINTQKIKSVFLNKLSNLITDLSLNSSRISVIDYLPVYQFINLIIDKIAQSPCMQDSLQALDLLKSRLPLENLLINTASSVTSSSSSILCLDKDILSHLDIALKCCRKQKEFVSEYLLRMLFVNYVLSNSEGSTEIIQKAIDLELDHLETYTLFDTLPGSEQEKYNHHFENYLDLLSKLFNIEISEQALPQKFSAFIYKLADLESEELSLPNLITLKRSVAFLQSRPEWFFYQNRSQARYQLIEARLLAENTEYEKKIDLQLLSLEIEQLTFGNGPSIDSLKSLLKQIISLKNTLSPSDIVRAMSMGVKVYELFLKIPELQGNQFKKIINTLLYVVKIGEENLETLDFKALQDLANCRFLLGFYSTFGFETQEEYSNGKNHLQLALNNFWTPKAVKHAINILNECCYPSEILNIPTIDPEKFLLLYRFKLVLLKDIHAFALSFLDIDNNGQSDCMSIQLEGLKDEKVFYNNENWVWNYCKKKFANSFISQDYKRAQNIVKAFFSYYYAKSKNAFDESSYFGSTRFSTLKTEETNSGINISFGIDSDKIKSFFSKAIEIPFMEYFLPAQEIEFFEGYLEMSVSISNMAGSKARLNDKKESQITYFYDIFLRCFHLLMEHEGELAYQKVINYTMRAYANRIITSDIMNHVFASSLAHLSKKERNEFDKLRHHVSTMSICCEIAMIAYRLSSNYLSEPAHVKYDHIFNRAYNAATIGQYISDSNEDKLYWCNKRQIISHQRFQSLQGRMEKDKVQEAYIKFLYSGLSRIDFLTESENKIVVEDEILSYLPNTYEEIETVLLSDFNVVSNEIKQFFMFICVRKAMHLVYCQETEEGLLLFNKCLQRMLNKPLNIDNYNLEHFKMEINISSTIINLKKLDRTYETTKSLDLKSELEPVVETANSIPTLSNDSEIENDKFSVPSNPQSVKNEVFTTLKEVMQRRLLKLEKKKSKSPSIVPESSSSTTPQTILAAPAIHFIKSKDMDIFNLFWQENNNSSSSSNWETRSFRNDFSISRHQALQLIIALGGKYEPNRGHGSHHVAHLPKIEFNGKDMGGLVDYETNELMITLTKDEMLKYYQIKQLRNIFIKQGFNPDTVKEKRNQES